MKLKITSRARLKGTIKISGSKNATLPLMVCALLTYDEIILQNIPHISDVLMMMKLLQDIGIRVIYQEDEKTLRLQKEALFVNLKKEDIKKIRASYYIMGALVANGLNFKTHYPGGCSFSKRPIDYHLDAFKKVGYQIIEKGEELIFQKLKTSDDIINYDLPKPSVGATINVLFISILRKGISIIHNPSLEPEVQQVIEMLKLMGANIIQENNTLKIEGVDHLHGITYKIMSDRIEAGSYLLLAASVKRSKIIFQNLDLTYLEDVLKTLKQMGLHFKKHNNQLVVKKTKRLIGINKTIDIYPAFPTDLQQILSVACLKAKSPSTIIDKIYPERLTHLKEIKKAKGIIQLVNHQIKIYPSYKLEAGSFYASDLRCGFACIVLAVIANGTSIIENAELILRGYENLIDKLRGLQVAIEEEKDDF